RAAQRRDVHGGDGEAQALVERVPGEPEGVAADALAAGQRDARDADRDHAVAAEVGALVDHRGGERDDVRAGGRGVTPHGLVHAVVVRGDADQERAAREVVLTGAEPALREADAYAVREQAGEHAQRGLAARLERVAVARLR